MEQKKTQAKEPAKAAQKKASAKQPAKKASTKEAAVKQPKTGFKGPVVQIPDAGPYDHTVIELIDVCRAAGRNDIADQIEKDRPNLGKDSWIVDAAIRIAHALLHDPAMLELAMRVFKKKADLARKK